MTTKALSAAPLRTTDPAPSRPQHHQQPQMPACVAFDPGTQLYTPKDQFDSISFLDQKAFSNSIFSSPLPDQHQLLTPPSSPLLQKQQVQQHRQAPAFSPFGQVPYEILDQIIGLIHADNSRGIYDVLRDISACCLVSRQFHSVAINWLYRHVPISDPYAFTKFLTQLMLHPEEGLKVKTLDFSPFSIVSLGRSANDNKQIKMVCSETLRECLYLTPNLQELLLTEALDPDLDGHVLRLIFDADRLSKLEAVDFCGSSRLGFVQGFKEMLWSHMDLTTNKVTHPFPPIQRLSLHGCQTLPPGIYHHLLPQLPHLTHLDLSSTQLDSFGLLSISPECRLRHLYIGNCGNVSGKAILKFLLHHPASMYLESLNIRISDELDHPIESRDVPLFLSALRSKGTLRMLDVCGMPVSDNDALGFPNTLVELSVPRSSLTSQGIMSVLSNLPELFYLDIEANLSGGRLRLSQYADVFTAIRRNHPNVRIVECSGSGIEATDEIYDILLGWHWLHGRSRRGWLVSKTEYDELQKANRGIVKIGWKANKLNCCSTRKDLHGHYWYYAYGR